MKNNPPWTYINSTDAIQNRDIGPQPPMGSVPPDDPDADPNGVDHRLKLGTGGTTYLWSSEMSQERD